MDKWTGCFTPAPTYGGQLRRTMRELRVLRLQMQQELSKPLEWILMQLGRILGD